MISFTFAYAVVGGITAAGLLDKKIKDYCNKNDTDGSKLTSLLKAGCIGVNVYLIYRLGRIILITFAML